LQFIQLLEHLAVFVELEVEGIGIAQEDTEAGAAINATAQLVTGVAAASIFASPPVVDIVLFIRV
jgi:hypothetical protein